MTPVRILHLTKSVGFYGAERVIVNLYETVNRNRFTISLAGLVEKTRPHREVLDEVEKRGGEIIALDCHGKLDPRSMKRLLSTVAAKNIQILHCHEIKSRLYGLLTAKLLGVPVVATNHNWTRENVLVGAYELLDAFYLRFFNRIIAVSDAVRDSMLRFGIKNRLISVIPNGINQEHFSPGRGCTGHLRRALGIDERARVIGAVGRLSPEKGFNFFLDAAKKILAELPQSWFLIVGDGPLKSQLSQYAKGLGIEDRVVFAGFHANVADIYSAMDVYVLTSLREGTPMALLEAMAMKVPVVAADVGGVSRILRHNHNGILLSSPDSQTISEAVLWLLNNPSESTRLGNAARTTVKDEFSAHRMAHEYENIYSDILDLSWRPN